MRPVRGNSLAMALCLGAAAILGAIVLVSRSQPGPRLINASQRQPDLSVKWHIGPTLRELLANFAVLRRPATAAEHAEVARFAAPTNGQTQVPEYVRLVGRVEGQPVYLVVYPLFRHETDGGVVAHMMVIDGGGNGGGLGGYSYRPGNYAIFPETDAAPGKPTAYVGIVPDGVRSVRWTFACVNNGHAGLRGCQLPSPRIANVAVHRNLAVLQTDAPYGYGVNGNTHPGVTRVTWFGPAGMSKVFTNQERAVPIAGAPAWTG